MIFVLVNTVINLAGVGSLKLANRVFLVIELVFVAIFVVIAVRAINGQSLPDVGWSISPSGIPAWSAHRCWRPRCPSRC